MWIRCDIDDPGQIILIHLAEIRTSLGKSGDLSLHTSIMLVTSEWVGYSIHRQHVVYGWFWMYIGYGVLWDFYPIIMRGSLDINEAIGNWRCCHPTGPNTRALEGANMLAGPCAVAFQNPTETCRTFVWAFQLHETRSLIVKSRTFQSTKSLL